MKLKLGGLYFCSFDRELRVHIPTSRKSWKVVGVMKANTPFVIIESIKNNKFRNANKSKRGDYLDIKILTNQGEIRYIFCYSDIIFKVVE